MRQYTRKTVFGLLIISLFYLVLSCQKKELKPVINEAEFVKVYTDYVVAVNVKQLKPVEMVLDSILTKHRFSKKDFESYLRYYAQNPKQWESFISNVIKQLQIQSVSDSSIKAVQFPQE